MAGTQISTKRIEISKANAQVLIAAGISGFITVFSLVASQALWSQNSYLLRVLKTKNAASQQLDANLKASDQLMKSYNSFVSKPINVISGKADGNGQNDGDNAKIVLDALPSSYDFPAMTASVQKILTDLNLKVSAITGVDDELAQQTATSSATPEPVPMNFTFAIANADYDSLQKLIDALEHSIRPIQVDGLDVAGGNGEMTITVTAHTYFQPPKKLDIKTEALR